MGNNKNMKQKLKAEEMWFWKKMMWIPWTDRLTNEVVLEKVGAERQLLNTIRSKKWKFVGHKLRKQGGVEKNILQAEMAGERARGRQRLKMLRWMMERLRVKDGEQLGEKDREKRTAMIRLRYLMPRQSKKKKKQ